MKPSHPVSTMLRALTFVGAAACTKPAPPSPALDAAPIGSAAAAPVNGSALVTTACLSCHTEEMLAQQRLPKEKWASTVKKMTGWGAPLKPEDREAVLNYLSDKFK